MELQQLLRLVLTLGVIGFVSAVVKAINSLVLEPRRLKSLLKKQGIGGPPSAFLLGNIKEIRKSKDSRVPETPNQMTHNCSSKLFPFFDQWRQTYGNTFVFSLGNIPILYTYDLDMVKEITTCTSLDLGKPLYQFKERGPLLGKGILTSNGATWAHQRKIIAPELYSEKVKGMINLIVESTTTLLNSWDQMIEKQHGTIDITIDKHMRTFSGDVISRACFGSNYAKGEEIFLKLRGLQEALSKNVLTSGIPALNRVPTKNNREIWKLEKEVKSLILDVVNERSKSTTSELDLLQMILEGAAGSNFSKDSMDRFIVDNCKNIYLAGYETTAVSASWTIMLLASSPEWQAKVRNEVLEVCRGQLPDNDSIRKMKVLGMVINESLRLYPPVAVVSREAFKDMKFGDVEVPKGVNVWALMVTLHQDTEIWGPDADQFKPERFANGVSGACKYPHVYMPFGVGPRTCLGQNLALAELKILIAMIVSKFTFSLSPQYKHSPGLRLVIEPEHGVQLLINRL